MRRWFSIDLSSRAHGPQRLRGLGRLVLLGSEEGVCIGRCLERVPACAGKTVSLLIDVYDMQEPRRITMADVAREAGVHVTTVSLALRDHYRIPATTKSRIRALAEKLGYRPDPLLSALSTYRSRSRTPKYQSTLAYLTNWETEWGWKTATGHSEFFSGAERAANELGFRLEHFWLKSPKVTEVNLSRILLARGISGLILASHGREMADSLQLDWKSFCCVKIDYFPHEPEVHNVTNHQCDIVRMAMRNIVRYGYRRMGLVMHRGWDHAVDHNWIAGYLCEQQQLASKDRIPALIYPNVKPIELWLKENTATIVPSASEFLAWFKRYRPEVIISNGAFVKPLFQELGIRVPRDVAFTDLFLSDFSGASAGVRQNHEVVGELAVQIVAGQLNRTKKGIPEIPTSTYVEGTWFDGASCPPRR